MIDELRYHAPAKRQIITREAALAAADEIEALRRERDTLALVGGKSVRDLHDALLKLNERTKLVQAMMARLADLLDDDHFNNMEMMVLDAGVPYPDEEPPR